MITVHQKILLMRYGGGRPQRMWKIQPVWINSDCVMANTARPFASWTDGESTAGTCGCKPQYYGPKCQWKMNVDVFSHQHPTPILPEMLPMLPSP